jgi:hypothetical protein
MDKCGTPNTEHRMPNAEFRFATLTQHSVFDIQHSIIGLSFCNIIAGMSSC